MTARKPAPSRRREIPAAAPKIIAEQGLGRFILGRIEVAREHPGAVRLVGSEQLAQAEVDVSKHSRKHVAAAALVLVAGLPPTALVLARPEQRPTIGPRTPSPPHAGRGLVARRLAIQGSAP